MAEKQVNKILKLRNVFDIFLCGNLLLQKFTTHQSFLYIHCNVILKFTTKSSNKYLWEIIINSINNYIKIFHKNHTCQLL